MFRRPGYKFTNKKHPVRGIMSFILGVISIGSIVLAVYLTVLNKGQALHQYGTVALLTAIFALTGTVLGILSLLEKDIYRFFPVLGLLLNILSVVTVGIILYAGVSRI